MPFSKLSYEQIREFLAEQPKMISVPGVALVCVDYVDSRRNQVAVVVTVYAGKHQEISRLPLTVAGLPVVVKVEDRRTGRVVEIIDPRKNGGTWPGTSHGDQLCSSGSES